MKSKINNWYNQMLPNFGQPGTKVKNKTQRAKRSLPSQLCTYSFILLNCIIYCTETNRQTQMKGHGIHSFHEFRYSSNGILPTKLRIYPRSNVSPRFHPLHRRLLLAPIHTHKPATWRPEHATGQTRIRPFLIQFNYSADEAVRRRIGERRVNEHRSGRGNKRRRRWIRHDAELVAGVGEEAHSAAAICSVFAELGPVARRVEPAFEDAVRELTRVAPLAVPLPVIGAGGAWVVVLAGVTAASLLGGVGVGTLGPVVGPATWTVPHLELEHSEMVGGE